MTMSESAFRLAMAPYSVEYWGGQVCVQLAEDSTKLVDAQRGEVRIYTRDNVYLTRLRPVYVPSKTQPDALIVGGFDVWYSTTAPKGEQDAVKRRILRHRYLLERDLNHTAPELPK
jgi:hypothetical protein